MARLAIDFDFSQLDNMYNDFQAYDEDIDMDELEKLTSGWDEEYEYPGRRRS